MLFDLDGTLVDSAPDITISLNLMLEELSISSCSLAQARDWMGNGAGRLIKRALTGQVDGEPSAGLFQRAHKLFLEFYVQHICEESVIFPGVVEGLNQLRDRSYVLALITNKPRVFVPQLLQTLKLDDYFACVSCGDDLPVNKPDPMQLYKVMEGLGFQASQALMVGDSASDINAAKAANVTSFCLRLWVSSG